MKINKILSNSGVLLIWAPILFFSVLLAHNAILYFSHGNEYGILPEKALARQDLLWNICFYIHLPTGILCLFTPVLLFAKKYFKKGLKLHELVGKIYVWNNFLFVCPTGMYLALYAKGGIISQTGFMLQGILLGIFTWYGYRTIINHDKIGHVTYMIRSYAMATSVLTFRIYHILFFFLKVPYHDNYAISQWLGMGTNALIAEILILFMTLKQSQKLKPINL
jgi:uncharacterized membrane protein